MNHRRTIRFTLGVVFAATLLVGGISVATTLHTLHEQRHDAPVVNLLGRERMLTMTLVSHTWALLETGDTTRTVAMARTVEQFEATLGVLHKGGTISYADQRLELPPPPEPFPQMLGQVLESWKRLQDGVQEAVRAEVAGLGHERAAGDLHDLADQVVAKLDEAVLVYSQMAQQRTTRLRLLQLAFLIAGALTVGFGYQLLRTQIARPVAALAQAMRGMERGDLDTPVVMPVANELGQLSEVFDQMRARVRSRIEEQGALAELSQRLVGDLEPEAIAEATLEATRERIGADAAAFLVPVEEERRIRVLAADGWAGQSWAQVDLTIASPESSGIAWAVHRREPLFVDLSRTDHPFAVSESLRAAGIATTLIVPVTGGGEHADDGDDDPVLGVLVVHSLTHRTFGAEEVEFLSLLARYAALALERARTHRAQLRAEFRYRAIFNQTYQFIGLLAPDGTMLDANDTSLQFAGTSRAEVVGRPFWEAPWWNHSPELARRLELAVAEAARGEFVRFEAVHPSHDGTLATIDFSLTPIHDTEGQVVLLVPEGRDISERKRTEEALRRSEQRFHGIVSIAAEAIIMMDEAQRITFFNGGAEQTFGYGSDEVVGQPLSMLIPERYRGGHEARVHTFAATAAGARRMGERGKIWGLRKNGEEFPAEASISMLDLGGERVFTAVLRDVSEREALESHVSRTRQLASIGTLTGGLAHHFNNVLTTIRGYTELLLAACEDPEQRADLEQIRHSSIRAATLTRQLLVFSGLQFEQPRVLELNGVIQQAEALLQSLVREDMRLEVELSAERPSILADPGQIEQILVNLVTNARDAMPAGGTIRIEVAKVSIDSDEVAGTAFLAPGHYAALRIRDSGHGMDAATIERACEPFFTTRNMASWSGLGLSTVYGIARKAGGDVRISSAPGEGTMAEVLIPLARRSAPESVAGRGERETPGAEVSSRVLIVEDETGVRVLVRKVLQRAGFSVIEATNGQEALALFDQGEQGIDLVITDVIMPEMSGPELARHVREQCPGIPVLFMSGYSEFDVGEQGLLEPDVPFLQKPFAPDALMGKVRDLIGAE